VPADIFFICLSGIIMLSNSQVGLTCEISVIFVAN